MKGWLVNIILLVSLSAIVLVYYQKDKHTRNHADYLTNSLSPLKKILPSTARISFRGVESDPVNYWEVYLISRYVLVPVNMSPDIISDSSLLVVRLDADSSSKFLDSNTTILWEHKDSAYHYLFIQKQAR